MQYDSSAAERRREFGSEAHYIGIACCLAFVYSVYHAIQGAFMELAWKRWIEGAGDKRPMQLGKGEEKAIWSFYGTLIFFGICF